MRGLLPVVRPSLVLTIGVATAAAIAVSAPTVTPPPLVEQQAMPSIEPGEQDARDAALRALERRFRPRPLISEAIEAWGASVGMPPEAMTLLREAIAFYRAEVAEVDADPVDRLHAQLVATHRWDRAQRRLVPVMTPEYLRLLEMQWSVMTVIRRAERDLMASFVALAPPQRQAQARRIVFARHFETAAVPTTRMTAAINVAAIVDTMRLDAETIAMIEPQLDAYVQRMTAVLGWRTDAAYGLERDRVRLLVDLGPHWEAWADDETRRSVADERAEIVEALVRTEAPISGLNQEALAGLSRALPLTDGNELRSRFWRLANPDLYREEAELSHLILRSMGNDRLANSELAGREAMVQSLQSALLRVGFAASDLEDRARVIDVTRSRQDALRRIELELQRIDAIRERREMLLGAAAGLEGMLTTDEMELFHAIRTWTASVNAAASADRWTTTRLAEAIERLRTPPRLEETNDGDEDPDAIDADAPGTDAQRGDAARDAGGTNDEANGRPR